MVITAKKKLVPLSGRVLLLFLCSFFLASCSTIRDEISQPKPPVPPAGERGDFISGSGAVFNSVAEIQSSLDDVGAIHNARYPVNTYKIEYISKGSKSTLVKASGLIAVPVKPTPSPIISYQHATTFTNAEAPSFQRKAGEKGLEIALASMGYIVFSADFVGYGSSFGIKHPYLQKLPSAYPVNDMLIASKTWIDTNNVDTNGQLFMTGYSQGGYVTMSAMQQYYNQPLPGLDLVTAFMGAGPYNISLGLNKLASDKAGFPLPRIKIPSFLAKGVSQYIEDILIPENGDVQYETDFLEDFLIGGRSNDVHNWHPKDPITLFHGADDETVPIISSESTVKTMKKFGADVKFIRCTEVPSSHKNCVLPYINLVISDFESRRTD